MPALKLDIEIEQGATFQREFTVTDRLGHIFDLTGFVARGKLRNNSGEVSAIFATSAVSNTVLIELTAVQTAELAAETYFNHNYDVEIESPTGTVYRIAKGRVLISAEQTK